MSILRQEGELEFAEDSELLGVPGLIVALAVVLLARIRREDALLAQTFGLA